MSEERGDANPRAPGGPQLTRFATRGEQRLSYESRGPEDGPPVLALHDLLADRAQLRALGEDSGASTIRLTLPDARGHGASPMISGRVYRTDELVADVLAVLDAEGLRAAHLVAIGWGALIALGLAVMAPERVISLVLAAPYLPALLAGGGETEPRYCEGLREVATAAEKGQIDRALDMYLGSRIGEHWRDGLPKSRLGAIRRAAGNLAPLLTGMIAAPFDRGALERVHAPVTILLGQDAAIDDRTTGDLLVSILPRARIEQIHAHTRALVAGDAEWVPAIARALVANAA